ncbi:MAG TPA: hypothetical protein PKA06_05885, partial [Gemmatales bacterium]|nr:hypothetical protein [Gemmatales bacterium]
MKLATLRQPRQGIILLVVLALITLFASIGVAFVYFSEQEVTKAAEQKAGETIKLPDADLLFNYVMRQVIFPTNNTASALVTQSLLENMYGRTNGTATGNVQAFNGTGWRSVFDPATGLDNLYQRNMQFRFYDEALHGSLNPPYTYPDHKHAFLGQVSANWTTFNNPPGNFSQWGPTAIARSFAREMKFRIAYTTNAGGSGFEDIILNPYSSNVFPSGTRHADFWRGINPLPIGDLPNAPVGDPLHRTYIPNATVLANPNGTAAMLNFTPDVARSLAFRPSGYTNPYFPPPTDLGGDVKNLPPEVRTLVGFNGRNPIFANNDSYWMDIGFPAIPYSNNKKIKPLAALFIMDNDGKTNLNVHGNLRGFDASGNFPTSSHGLGPWEVNLMKLGLSIEEMRALLAGNTVGATSVRGRNGFAPAALNFDPSTIQNSYLPLLRGTSPYAQLDVDGTHDGLPPTNDYARTINYQLAGEPLNPLPWQNQPAFPVGHSSGSAIEYLRGGAFRSPFFTSPFAQNQVIGNGVSDNTGSFQRTFPLSNQEMLYRFRDTGSDKLSSDVRKLISINNNPLNLPQLRWQMTMLSSDLNVAGVAPWWGPSPGNPLNYPPPPATPPYNIPFDLLTQGAAGVPVPLPAASPPVPPPPPFPGVPFNIGEFSHQHWRS